MGFEQQLGKQRLDLFPPKGRLGAGPARASRGQGGPQGASRGRLAGGSEQGAAQKVVERRPGASRSQFRSSPLQMMMLIMASLNPHLHLLNF